MSQQQIQNKTEQQTTVTAVPTSVNSVPSLIAPGEQHGVLNATAQASV